MRTVTSADGTEIAVWQSGSGPPLVLVHGTTADHHRWSLVSPFLERHCTVHAVDRRGRGASRDGRAYAITREGEDVAAVLASIGEPVTLVGHSYGAVCALEATMAHPDIHGLVLYEPPQLRPDFLPSELRAEMEAQLAASDREGVLLAFFRRVVSMPEDQLAKLRAHPAWAARIAAAHTIPRELATDGGYRLDVERVRRVRAPVLLLVGEISPPAFQAMNRELHRAIPGSQLLELKGQGHVAMDASSERFADLLVAFMKGDREGVARLAQSFE